VLNRAAHDFLRLAVRVPFSTVEEVDACIEGRFQTSESIVIADVSSIRQPATEGDGRNLQAALAHEAVLHFREILGCS
jgi:hypothetical protein